MKKPVFCVVAALLFAASLPGAVLHLTKPNGGESLSLGSPYKISWTSSGITNPLKLALFLNGVKIGDIVENLSPGTTSYDWTVGNYTGGQAVPGGGFSIRVRTMDGSLVDNSDSPFAITSGPFALSSPNGGESWALKSVRQITWNPGDVTGSVGLYLYKGGTDITHRVGTITDNTSAAAGAYSWTVGKLINDTAQPGAGYLIGIKSYAPEKRDTSNTTFTIMHEMAPPIPIAVTGLELTFPRRGDRWYKGTGYNIKWNSTGLTGIKLKLKLVKSDGTTLVENIAADIPNNGQYYWVIPMSLPDAENFYKIRIQTMDNAYGDLAGPFPIAKDPAAGPRVIHVIAPGGPGQLSNAAMFDIRWTSTCGTSVNGPTDDGFDIDLMNSAGTVKIRQLFSSKPAYDGRNPDGSHGWHWSCPAGLDPGTYRIRVTDWAGRCVGLGEPFTLVYPQEFIEIVVKPTVNNCFYLGNWVFWGEHSLEANVANLSYWGMAGGDPALARVGYRFFVNNTWKNALHNDSYGYQHQIILRSFLAVNPYWYKDKGQGLLSAKLIITRKWEMPPNVQASDGPTHPCLGGVALLEQASSCQTTPNPQAVNWPPVLNGLMIAVATDQGDTWEVDVSDFYRAKIQKGKPDLGWVLYPYHGADPGPGMDSHSQYTYQNVERYDVVLKVRMAKDVK